MGNETWMMAVGGLGGLILLIGILLFWRQGQQSEKMSEILKEQDVLMRNLLADEMGLNRREVNQQMSDWASSLQRQLSNGNQLQTQQLEIFSNRLDSLTKSTEERLETVRQSVESRLTSLQTDNASKLEQMRQTVDEKLHATLERRLGESFQMVSERLEKVHTGLGEMQKLATNVGDLKKVMTQVKTRGIWGEMQLTRLLEEFLPKQIWERNVATRPNRSERVEVAIRIPQDNSDSDFIWLPIDAKFPMEDYERLLEARESGESGEEALKALVSRIKLEARSIQEKYIESPYTTDFALMFVPTESLYAEIVSNTDLVEEIQKKERIILVGPTNLAAFLSSLQMGFRALVVEKQTGEILRLLGGVKAEMGNFAVLLEKSQKKIQEVGNHIGQAARRGRVIERHLKNVEALPWEEGTVLGVEEAFIDPSDEPEASSESFEGAELRGYE